MKYLALLSLCLLSCASDITARQAVIDDLKTSEVQRIPSCDRSLFLARTTEGAVWLVQTSVLDGSVAVKTLLFPAPAARQPEREEGAP